MGMSFEQTRGFIDGVIAALDHRIQIVEDKDLKWSVGHVDGKTQPLTVVEFTWVEFFTTEDEEPHYTGEHMYLDGTETTGKIVRDIEDILERIDEMELEYKSRREMLADAYSD